MGEGKLEILEELVLADIPRARDGSMLRVTRVSARSPEGFDVGWHSLRIFFRSTEGDLRPTKAGITIRGRELDDVVAALSGTATPNRTTQEGPRARPSRDPRPRQAPAPALFDERAPGPAEGVDDDAIF